MAIKKTIKSHLQSIEIISQYDTAVDHDASDIDAYLVDPIKNRDKLVLVDEPTIFICNFSLTGKQKAQIKDVMIKGIDPEDKSAKLAFGKWSYVVCQMTLKGIKNPPNVAECIEFKKDGSGLVSDATMDELVDCGVAQEIFNHYINLTSDEGRVNSKN